MTHGIEHHIEHAEHATHAAHDPFDRQVTMTIAIVAAILAFVTMLAHRTHNQTLVLQGEAISLQTEGSIRHTQTTNKWAYFQAQNIRSHFYQAFLETLDVAATKPGTEDKQKKTGQRWEKQVAKYESNLPKIEEEAKKLEKETHDLQVEAQKKLQESHEAHLRADRLDFGELGVELALILCSIAVLTKRRVFWYVGMTCGAVGVVVATSGYFGLLLGGHHM